MLALDADTVVLAGYMAVGAVLLIPGWMLTAAVVRWIARLRRSPGSPLPLVGCLGPRAHALLVAASAPAALSTVGFTAVLVMLPTGVRIPAGSELLVASILANALGCAAFVPIPANPLRAAARIALPACALQLGLGVFLLYGLALTLPD